jgi:hypothetical protein
MYTHIHTHTHTQIHTYIHTYINIYIHTCYQIQVNEPFLDTVSDIVQELNNGADNLQLIRGPIKKPERALQKLVRLYNRDAAALTDLVRCTVVVDGLHEAHMFLQQTRKRSVVGVVEQEHEDAQPNADVIKHVHGIKDVDGIKASLESLDSHATVNHEWGGSDCGGSDWVGSDDWGGPEKIMCITKLNNRSVRAYICMYACMYI